MKTSESMIKGLPYRFSLVCLIYSSFLLKHSYFSTFPAPLKNTLFCSDFKGIYQECAQVLYLEIDYINEGRNR